MNCVVPTAHRAAPWRITFAAACDDGWSIELECGGVYALASFALEDRGGRPGQPAAWRVRDVSASDDAAQAWLEDPAHFADVMHELARAVLS